MNIGVQVICRNNSSRLPGKILKEIQGKPVLQYIIERIETVVDRNSIVISTSIEDTDNTIVEYCKMNKLNYYRGSLNNVAERFLQCALQYGFDYTVRINGDNIFVDPFLLNKMIDIAATGKYDFISNVKNRTFPKGMSVEIVRTDYYKKRFDSFNSPRDFEHVTINLYENEKKEKYYYVINDICHEASGLQLALDTHEDFVKIEAVINQIEGSHINYGLKEIFNIYESI